MEDKGSTGKGGMATDMFSKRKDLWIAESKKGRFKKSEKENRRLRLNYFDDRTHAGGLS